MKQYLSVVLVTVICIACIVLAVFWRTSHTKKSISINDLPSIDTTTVIVYDDNVNVYQDAK